jgi:hypothetical protein
MVILAETPPLTNLYYFLDAEFHICREEFHHHLPRPHGHHQPSYQQEKVSRHLGNDDSTAHKNT